MRHDTIAFMSNVTLTPGGPNVPTPSLPPTPNMLQPVAAVPILPGQPLARSRTVAGAAQLCSAHSGAGKIALCSGLCANANPVSVGERALMQYAGTLELTVAQWQAITAGAGLVEGDGYYVSDTDGMLTNSAPGGLDADTFVGIAQSTTVLLLQLVSGT
jgi:hypothetical protein